MRVFIAGVDGYLGWTLAQYLTARGHLVGGCDNHNRRKWVEWEGSQSATPILNTPQRLVAFRDHYGEGLLYAGTDLTHYNATREILRKFKPDAIVHLGEMPSAPFSMIDAQHAVLTHANNLTGTLNILFAMREVCPEAQLVKLGTMGEYGTPNVDIPEGFFDIEYRGRRDTLPFPSQPGSFYHCTKVHDSVNIRLACNIWGLCSTDIMQGVVYGTRIDEMRDNDALLTRFDFDQCFGTIINRFCASAVVGEPLTLYGVGHQRRGFLPLRDSMQCLTIAIENPPQAGEYRVFNQFEETYNLTVLAERVKAAGEELGLGVQINNYENPRVEAEEHYYQPDHQHLLDLGYKPTHDMMGELRTMLKDLTKHRDRIQAKRNQLVPDIRWSGERRKVEVIKPEVTP